MTKKAKAVKFLETSARQHLATKDRLKAYEFIFSERAVREKALDFAIRTSPHSGADEIVKIAALYHEFLGG